MKKLMYVNKNGIVSIVIPSPKERIEKVRGPMTDAEYKAHVIERSIPKGVSYKEVDDLAIPESREFRNAWVDITPEAKVDICCEKAKNIKLEDLRRERNKKLEALDKDFILALEKGEDLEPIKAEKQRLRDVTKPVKALDVAGKINDDVLLKEIKDKTDPKKVL